MTKITYGMSYAWLDDTPYVTEIVEMGDGQPSIKVHDARESLKRMYAEIQRLTALIDGSPCPIKGPHECDRTDHSDGSEGGHG